jgi:hypothetical protein
VALAGAGPDWAETLLATAFSAAWTEASGTEERRDSTVRADSWMGLLLLAPMAVIDTGLLSGRFYIVSAKAALLFTSTSLVDCILYTVSTIYKAAAMLHLWTRLAQGSRGKGREGKGSL